MLMTLRGMLLSACAVLAFSLTSAGDPPAPPGKFAPPPPDAGGAGLPVGKWTVAFANGVTETCEVKKDGTASVVEPARRSCAKVVAKGGSFLIACEDDRLERWTPVGKRMVVEHWYPGSQVPVVTPVLGIAEPAQ
jgi:hypothetical protein